MNALVLDAHTIYRQGLVVALTAAHDVDEVRQAQSVTEVRGSDLLEGVHVLLVDTELDGAADLLRSVREAPWPKALACSSQDDQETVIAAIESGAIGFLSKKTLTPATLLAAVEAAVAGNGVLAADLLAAVLARISETSRTVLEPRGITLSRLNTREQDVLRLLAAGHGTREVADQLYFSERTVKSVVHDALTKLGAKSRAHAVAFAIREGLI